MGTLRKLGSWDFLVSKGLVPGISLPQ